MALIKCSDCGRDVSPNAFACPNCGNPIRKERSVVIIYGISQGLLFGGKVKIYKDGVFVDHLRKGGKLEIPLEKDVTISLKIGINPSRPKINVPAGKTTKLQVVYNRMTGNLYFQEIETATPTIGF